MGLLLLMMTFGGLGLAFLLFVISLIRKKTWLTNFVLGGVVIWFAFYGIFLVGTSLLSEEKTLTLNEPKNYCGFYLDCHMHTAVSGVRKTKTIGDKTAKGEFYIVKVKVFSDAKGAKLGLHSVYAKILDANGNEFERDAKAEEKLGKQMPFDKRITPEESFEKEIVFDLPNDAENPRLDIQEGSGIERAFEAVLIGDEDSIWHKRKYFELRTEKQIAGN